MTNVGEKLSKLRPLVTGLLQLPGQLLRWLEQRYVSNTKPNFRLICPKYKCALDEHALGFHQNIDFSEKNYRQTYDEIMVIIQECCAAPIFGELVKNRLISWAAGCVRIIIYFPLLTSRSIVLVP